MPDKKDPEAAKRSRAAKKAAETRKANATDGKPLADPPRVDALADATQRAPDGVEKPKGASSRKVSEAVDKGKLTVDEATDGNKHVSVGGRSGPRKADTVKVKLRDANDQTVYDVTQLVVGLGGTVRSTSGANMVAEVPLGSDRDPSAARNKLIHGVSTSPLVEDVSA